MKRTIKEVYDLVKEKQYNSQMGSIKETFKKDKLLCLGQAQAYQDVLSLLESSHLLEEDKPVEGRGLEALDHIKTYSRLDVCRGCQYYKNGKCENNIGECMWKDDISIIEKDLLFVEIFKKTFKYGVEEQKIGDTKLNWKVIAEKLTNEYDKQIRDFILKECFPKELKALNEILALHDKWLGNKISDFEFFTLLTEIKDKYDLLEEVLV